MHTAATTSHAALTASPRVRATMPSATVPNTMTAPHSNLFIMDILQPLAEAVALSRSRPLGRAASHRPPRGEPSRRDANARCRDGATPAMALLMAASWEDSGRRKGPALICINVAICCSAGASRRYRRAGEFAQYNVTRDMPWRHGPGGWLIEVNAPL